MGYKDYFQAGKSVGRIHGVETVAQIMSSFSNELNVKNVMENEVEGANHD